MKKMFYVFLLFFALFSCSDKHDEVFNEVSRVSNLAMRSNASCEVKTAKSQDEATGGSIKRWLVFYYDIEGNLIDHPLIDNVNGTVYEYTKVNDTLGSVREFTGGDTIILINYGTYRLIECGTVFLPNTQIFKEDTRVEITKLNSSKLETYILAPIGVNGSIVPIVGKGKPF